MQDTLPAGKDSTRKKNDDVAAHSITPVDNGWWVYLD